MDVIHSIFIQFLFVHSLESKPRPLVCLQNKPIMTRFLQPVTAMNFFPNSNPTIIITLTSNLTIPILLTYSLSIESRYAIKKFPTYHMPIANHTFIHLCHNIFTVVSRDIMQYYYYVDLLDKALLNSYMFVK